MIRRRHRIPNATRILTCQPLEERRVLAASLGWDGPGLGSAELTYYIANSPSSLSAAETTAAIETALSAWSSAADIKFTRTTQPGLRDSIDFSFAPIDGAGGTLAEAYFPDDVNPARIAGDVQFDSSEVWEVGNALGSRAMDLVWVAVHEIGHSLGLDHLNVAGSILAPYVSPNQFFVGLPAVDVAAIQKLYAAPTAPASNSSPTTVATPTEIPTQSMPTTPTPVTPTTTPTENSPNNSRPFFHGRWYRWTSWHTFGGRLEATVVEHHNMAIPTDVNGDATTSPIDALQIVKYLNQLSICHHGDGIPTGSHGLSVGWLSSSSDQWFARLDKDADNSLVQDEVPAKLWDQLVSLGVDADSDGLITRSELEAGVAAARAEYFSEQDVNSDGLLTQDEVGQRLWQRLSLADTDGDAEVSLAEFDAWLDARAAQNSELDHHRPRWQNVDRALADLGDRPRHHRFSRLG